MKPIRNYRGEVGINLTYLHIMRNYSNTFSSKSQAFRKIFINLFVFLIYSIISNAESASASPVK